MSKYIYLVVYTEDTYYGPVWPTKKAFFSPAKAQEFCKKMNNENEEGHHYFTREVEMVAKETV